METTGLRPEDERVLGRIPRLTIQTQRSRCGGTEAEELTAKTCQHANGTKDAARGGRGEGRGKGGGNGERVNERTNECGYSARQGVLNE